MLDLVTITGADDATDIGDLHELADEFHFAEFAVLASVSRHGTPRYPSIKWMERFTDQGFQTSSIHLCGQYARDAVDGKISPMVLWFDRCQINFTAAQNQDIERMSWAISAFKNTKFIVQDNPANHDLCDRLEERCNFSRLFDGSGGRGAMPDSWLAPKKYPESFWRDSPLLYFGYAGGLTPDNLAEQLPLMDKAAGGMKFWIDAESGLRTDDRLDLAKSGASWKSRASTRRKTLSRRRR